MIPGPIEFEPAVLQKMGEATTSHVAPDFIETFGNALDLMKQVWRCPSGQPFVVAGSGTLAMDMAGANLVEPDDNCLVLSTGYFGERFAALLKRYGARVTVLNAPLGETVALDRVRKELAGAKYKLLVFTHVDTSTAVRVDPQPLARLAAEFGVATILDGVCSVASEEIRQEEWGIDVVLTASQKGIGVPPGLALMVVSPRALEISRNRRRPVPNYYADWSNWLPIMEAYAARRPAYFGTPPVNLIAALEVSLRQILDEGMDARVVRHRRFAAAFRAAMRALGLAMIPVAENVSANTLTAAYYPEGVDGSAFMAEVLREGVIVAGGLLPDIKSSYFRVGHMGAVSRGDILSTIGAIEAALARVGKAPEPGIGLAAAQRALHS
jgi:alanine-glyoxylate transaminase/serine-glyoxylate transaminase/serine-pyruvate transaminase